VSNQEVIASHATTVVDAIGQAVDIVGHSFGGLCALEAALRADGIRRLILYEAVPLRGADNYPTDVIPKLDALLAANQVEPALVTMLREIVGLGAADIDMLRRDPEAWATRLSNTRAMPRELHAEHECVFLPERFTNLRVATLLLVGEASAARELSSARGVAAVLPSARIRLLPERQHLAMYTAPDMFVRAVLEFLAEH
jgi:pimeloyl-ACP methyl ester carboxylesterase